MSDAAQIQAQLRSLVQRASRAGDTETSTRIREEGRRLVFLLAGLVKASRVYSSENDALVAPSSELATIASGLLHTLGTIQFILVDDQVFMNDIRLRVRPAEQVVVDGFMQELGKHAVGGLSLHEPLDPAQIRAVAAALEAHPEGSAPRSALARRLAAIADIQVTGRWRFRIGGEASDLQRGLDEIIADGANVLATAATTVGANRILSALPIRRLVIDLVEGLRRNPLAAAAVPFRFRDLSIAERHLVAVCGLAVLVGQQLGLDEPTLADLGLAAILHDVGYVLVPDRNRHPEAGTRLLMRQRGFHEAKIRRLLTVLEHHRPLFARDASPGEEHSPPTLFARIVRLANDYDVLVSPRPRQVPPLPPPQALATLWGGRGRNYDPVLVALFARVLGRYPPGTLLELSDWRWAVSLSGGRDQERFAHPVVSIVRGADGAPVLAGGEVDLWEAKRRLEIRRVVDPALSGFDLSPALDAAFGE